MEQRRSVEEVLEIGILLDRRDRPVHRVRHRRHRKLLGLCEIRHLVLSRKLGELGKAHDRD